MATWVSSYYTPITHPWFAKPSMKRKHASSESPRPESSDTSSASTPPSHSDSDSPNLLVNPHKPKRRRFSTLEKGFSHLSLDQQQQQHDYYNVGGFYVDARSVSVSPDARLVSSSQLPDISEMSAPVYQQQGNGNEGGSGMEDEMQYENLNVVRPAQVEEPYDHPPTPPIHEINMKSSSWYEPEPDRIVVTDLDSSEDEADVEDNPISLPPSILKHIAARNIEMMAEKHGRPMGDAAKQALVLFRPLGLVPPPGAGGVEKESGGRTGDGDVVLDGQPFVDEDAMDVEI